MKKQIGFTLEKQTCRLVNFNTRPERHGEDPVPAADLKIEYSMPNDELCQFHPALKALLYHFDKKGEQDLIDQAREGDKDYAPHLRVPEIESPIKLKTELVGAMVSIDYGLKSVIDLHGCNVNDFKIDPQPGGTVLVSFRIQAHPDGSQAGKIYDLMGCEISLTIEPPAPSGELQEAA
jgi:hypothetical protein